MADIKYDLRDSDDGHIYMTIDLADFVDRSAPYIGPPKYELRTEDSGAWSDLSVSRIENGADGYQRYDLNDGPVRAELLSIGIQKDLWEAASQEQRKVVVEALSAVVTIKSVLARALGGTDSPEERSATRLAEDVADLVARHRRDKAGFAKAGAPPLEWIAARDLTQRIQAVLSQANREALSNPRFNDDQWVASVAAAVNALLVDGFLVPLRGRCTVNDVRELNETGRRPSHVAAQIVSRAVGISYRDLLGRTRRRSAK